MTGAPREADLKGNVGFFWIVNDNLGEALVLSSTVSLDKAEPYGDALTHHGGHYDFWEGLRATPAVRWPLKDIPRATVLREYEEWPRGRVVFSSTRKRFTVYADRRVQNARLIDLIATAFSLPEGLFDVMSDPHYR